MKPATYIAFEEKNGTWCIQDVPIFSEVPKGEKNAPEDIGRAWLEKAIDAAAKLERENQYLPPLHIGHHKPGETVTGAGHFRLRRIRSMQFDGTERYVLTADLVGLTKEAFDDIMLGKYPYRSVEINDWAEARINHLALLSHQEPFFKFPLLNGTTIQLEKRPAKAAQYASCSGKKALILFCEETPEETTVKKPAKKPDVSERLQKLLPMFSEEDEAVEMTVEEAEEALAAALEQAEKFAAGEVELSEEEQDALCDDIEALADLFEDGEPEGEEETEEEELPDDNPRPAKLSKQVVKQAAKLAALEDKVETFEATQAAEKEKAALVAKATADLAGYHLTKSTKERIESFAEMGEEALAEFVASYKEHATKEPITLAVEKAGTDPVLKDLKVGPEHAELALKLAEQFDVSKKRGLISANLSKKDYIAINLEAAVASAAEVE